MQAKAEYVANTGKSKWQSNDVSDMKVQVHGDTAVVTGVWTAKGSGGTGQPFDGKERFADTWVKMSDGKWRVHRERQRTDEITTALQRRWYCPPHRSRRRETVWRARCR